MLLYQNDSNKVLAAYFEVCRNLQPGLLESVYEKALVYELHQQGLKAIEQQPLQVQYKGMIIGNFKPDIVVEDKIILELKAVNAISNEHIAQLINYLVITGYQVGYVLNFGNERSYKRCINFKNNISNG
jgi:GxxExxY protein